MQNQAFEKIVLAIAIISFCVLLVLLIIKIVRKKPIMNTVIPLAVCFLFSILGIINVNPTLNQKIKTITVSSDFAATLGTMFCVILVLALIIIPILAIIFKQDDRINNMPQNTQSIAQITMNDVDHMSGETFEKYCAKLLRGYGYTNIQFTKATGDFGVDIIAYGNNRRYAIQCKRYSSKLGGKSIQEVVAGCNYYNCDEGMVMTNNFFTDNAIKLANANGVTLVDRNDLIKMIRSL